jgi:hypothetical protein
VSLLWKYMFCVRRDCMVFGIYLLCTQLVSITANIVRISRSWRGVLDTTLNYEDCQWLEAGRWFSPVTPISSTNKTDRQEITEILLKEALHTITVTHLCTSVSNNIKYYEAILSKNLKYFVLASCQETIKLAFFSW